MARPGDRRRLVAGDPAHVRAGLCRYWGDDYDWRRVEAELNTLRPAALHRLDGLGIHVLTCPSPESTRCRCSSPTGGQARSSSSSTCSSAPDPAAHGGDPADAFHVVVPSLPGYGFSAKPTEPGWGSPRIAERLGRADGRASATSASAPRAATGARRSRLASASRTLRTASASTSTCAPVGPPATTPLDDGPSTSRRPWPRSAYTGVGHRLLARSRPPARRPSATGSSTRRSASAAWIAREVLGVDRSRWRPAEAVITRDQLLDNVSSTGSPAPAASSAPAVLGELPPAGQSDPVERPGRACRSFLGRSPRRHDAGRSAVTRHPVLERARPRRPLRRVRAARLFVDEVRSLFRTVR